MDAISHANTVLMLGSVLILAGILSSLVATRFGAPMLLIFLGVGMLAGEDGPGGIQFSNYSLAYQIGSLALAVILFDGGLNTRVARFRRALAPAGTLATAGVLVTALLTGGLAILTLGLQPLEGFLIGAIVASTDAAAVFFLLRTGGLQLKTRVGATLEIESGTNDPFAIFLTIATIGLIVAGQGGIGGALIDLVREAFFGTLIGGIGGFATVLLLNRMTLPAGLHPLLVTAAVVLVYAFTQEIDGSGFLAVYIAGLIVGNLPVRAFASIASLHEAMTWLAQIIMFLMLGLLVTPHTLLTYAAPALGIALFLIFVARPAAVFLCLAPFGFDWREKAFIGWVGLRGAVSIFLSAIPILIGLPNAALYFNIAFFVVLVSLLLQGWTIKLAARKLQQAGPRQTAHVARVELDLPGQLDLEMVGYPVLADSPVLLLSTPPAWMRIALVVRGGEVLEPGKSGMLREGDYAYLLVPPARVQRLDRLFAAAAERGAPVPFAGEFAIKGDASIGMLAELYALPFSAQEKTRTVTDIFAERFDTPPEPGESLDLGRVRLVAREVKDERVVRAGLQWIDDELAHPLLNKADALWARLKERFHP